MSKIYSIDSINSLKILNEKIYKNEKQTENVGNQNKVDELKTLKEVKELSNIKKETGKIDEKLDIEKLEAIKDKMKNIKLSGDYLYQIIKDNLNEEI